MNYQAFKEQLFEQLSSKYEPDIKVSHYEIIKNNNQMMESIILMDKNIGFSPAIYLEPLFTQFQRHQNMNQILEDIAEIYHSSHRQYPFQNFQIQDFESCKERLALKLIHFNSNKSLLETIPYQKLLDLALVMILVIEGPYEELATLLVTYKHMEFWNIDEDTLFKQCIRNSKKILPSIYYPIETVLEDLMKDMTYFYPKGEETPVYQDESIGGFVCQLVKEKQVADRMEIFVLTNDKKIFGATTMIYPGVLKEISRQFDDDLFVLPSSIHEVLLIRADNNLTPEELSDIVIDINEKYVHSQDVLSDHIYYYDRIRDNIISINQTLEVTEGDCEFA